MDARASRPRPLRPPLALAASLAGVPREMRARIGRNLQSTGFPYPQFLHGGSWGWDEVELVELENARWRVVVCPSLGGRVLRIFDRRLGRDLLLQPPAVPQGVVGLPGAWFVGGVEFNAFRLGHNVHGQSTILSRQVRLANGDLAVELSAPDELFGTEWGVTIALGESQVFFRVELRNRSDVPQPDYWWTTIAVPAHRQTRVMAAPGPALHHGMFRTGYQSDRWPFLHSATGVRDWSRWPEHRELASVYFHEHDSDFFGCVDAASSVGFVHLADRSICRGRKMWSISAGRDNVIWSNRLLEPALPSYLELQSGLHPTQLECGLLEPGERRFWTESIGAIAFEGAAEEIDYGELFRRYEATARAEMQREYATHQPAAPWETKPEAVVLTAATERIDIATRVIRAPESVSAAEIATVTGQGWVAGKFWIQALEMRRGEGTLAAAGRLALAAAQLDAGDTQPALAELKQLAASDDEVGGWAAVLLGSYQKERGWLERAAARLPERADVWLALDDSLAGEGKHAERRELWSRVPVELRDRDDVRVARAACALALGEWAEARSFLQAPLPSVPEGSPTPWLIYRETFVAEAAESWYTGELEAATTALFLAGQPAPQFGVGRDEAGWGGDLLYYRWRAAKQAGRAFEADMLLAVARDTAAYAGSVSAAYLARLLSEANDPVAARRIDELRRWDLDTDGQGRAFSPLRAVVVQTLTSGRNDGWRSFLEDPLYRHRAALELEVL